VGWMKVIEAVSTRQNKWAELIWQQSRSNLSVSAFCREHGVSDQSSYNWRKRWHQASLCGSRLWMPLLQRIALPSTVGCVRYPGIKIHDARIRRLEVLSCITAAP
jgi:hypothetical protein